jgi:hypothetical protein
MFLPESSPSGVALWEDYQMLPQINVPEVTRNSPF